MFEARNAMIADPASTKRSPPVSDTLQIHRVRRDFFARNGKPLWHGGCGLRYTAEARRDTRVSIAKHGIPCDLEKNPAGMHGIPCPSEVTFGRLYSPAEDHIK